MTTKHEGKCCEKCWATSSTNESPAVSYCRYLDCSCHTTATAVDGAGMREFIANIRKYRNVGADPFMLESLIRSFQSELSRLHSQILEEVEKNSFYIIPDKPLINVDQAKTIINQAFKDL